MLGVVQSVGGVAQGTWARGRVEIGSGVYAVRGVSELGGWSWSIGMRMEPLPWGGGVGRDGGSLSFGARGSAAWDEADRADPLVSGLPAHMYKRSHWERGPVCRRRAGCSGRAFVQGGWLSIPF